MPTRRIFLMLILLGFASQAIPRAAAGDGDGGGGDGGGDGGDDGGDDGGGDSSGKGDGDDGKDDDAGDDGKDDDAGDDGKDDDDGEDDGDDDGKDVEDAEDDDRIRAAVRSGKAEPLRDILLAVRKRYKGDVVRIRLTGKGKGLLYRIRIINPDNRLIEVRVNAGSGRILGATGL